MISVRVKIVKEESQLFTPLSGDREEREDIESDEFAKEAAECGDLTGQNMIFPPKLPCDVAFSSGER
jgi:hypothetical protein